eukprot:scaffold3290_cov165-Ochromonas_danica.AAC.47
MQEVPGYSQTLPLPKSHFGNFANENETPNSESAKFSPQVLLITLPTIAKILNKVEKVIKDSRIIL